ncbi:helix-turn-helix domain-containing protein [Planotetraspora mira]|uniref:HTH cro/C1-type domain-containing protein n=1 Tax=Planotetraspora mira TaxID=58121 RepID=A0A8J3TXS6_9ACTN|nr:helix-turn-helix transcriptional regulator [Planotetraspora mira]GII34588.1 hypothetical protein Pmi06nite_80300 [Planotetraspora mira]
MIDFTPLIVEADDEREGVDVATEHMTTGQRIARARHRKGWDQATLAEKIGRSVSWLSKVENGRLPLDRMSVVGQVAEVLGVEISELTGHRGLAHGGGVGGGRGVTRGLSPAATPMALDAQPMTRGRYVLRGREVLWLRTSVESARAV